MRPSDIDDNVPRQELRTLQRLLRTRASNLKKKAKRHGLIRPLSQIDTGSQRCLPLRFRNDLSLARSYVDFGLATIEESPVTCLRNGQKLAQPLAFIIDPEVVVWSTCSC